MDIFSQGISEEKDILAARDRARIISEEMGYGVTQQLQISTAVFELGKNILEHGGGGEITFAILTEDDSLALEVEGRDDGPGLSEEQADEMLKSSGSSTALRGIPAMKRMMDKIEIESEPGAGTLIRLLKKKPDTAKTLARNIVSFFNKKFSSRKSPSISEEMRAQNQNLVQTLSLFEEKNEELKKTNQALLDLKQELEGSNDELQQRTTELQDALLSLGDRTTELEAQNRRFTALMKLMNDGVAITDRSGAVTHANALVCEWLETAEPELQELSKSDWLELLGSHWSDTERDWKTLQSELQETPANEQQFQLTTKQKFRLQCRTSPMQDQDGKVLGRLWFFRPVS
ncbi:MAG: PAS domain-containing protein [Candidatus Hinthialibacter antarcticus]|nr:PAS domain-containing protein [Candidatus Hinthialibacter antarcticus]